MRAGPRRSSFWPYKVRGFSSRGRAQGQLQETLPALRPAQLAPKQSLGGSQSRSGRRFSPAPETPLGCACFLPRVSQDAKMNVKASVSARASSPFQQLRAGFCIAAKYKTPEGADC